MRDVEKVLDDQDQRQTREYQVQDRYPDHVDPGVVVVGGADTPIQVQCDFDIATVAEIVDLRDIPQVAVRSRRHLPRNLILKLIIYGKEFNFWE